MRNLCSHRKGRPTADHRLALALILAALTGACTSSEASMHSVQADIGGATVSLPIPDGLVATLMPGGLSIRRMAEGRQIHDMTLTPATGASPVQLVQTHGTGAEAIHYGMARSGGGSGGEDVTMIAERRCGAVTLRLRLATQADEDGPADIDQALAMLADTGCGPTE